MFEKDAERKVERSSTCGNRWWGKEGAGVDKLLGTRRYFGLRWQHCQPRNKSHPCRVERERQERKLVHDRLSAFDRSFK